MFHVKHCARVPHGVSAIRLWGVSGPSGDFSPLPVPAAPLSVLGVASCSRFARYTFMVLVRVSRASYPNGVFLLVFHSSNGLFWGI